MSDTEKLNRLREFLKLRLDIELADRDRLSNYRSQFIRKKRNREFIALLQTALGLV